MLIFTNTITPRLQYVANFVAQQICNKAAKFTTNAKEYVEYEGIKINYTNQYSENYKCWQQPHSLLFEENIHLQPIQVFDYNGYPAFFKTKGSFGFDFFAASFYLISRYEEYLPHAKDEYGRYAHTNSLAFKNNFLNVPLVNIWLNDVKQKLQQAFPNFHFSNSAFQFLPTYDIDEAYAYKNKSLIRTWGGALKDVLAGNFRQLKKRIVVVGGNETDPYDSYQWLDELHSTHHLNSIYFFLIAEQKQGYDKNISPKSQSLQQLIKQHSDNYEIGIHPSWQSGNDEKVLCEEITLLQKISDKQIVKSRQHYIRFAMPYTFRFLLQNGITDDYSMGYGSINGFRASVASSFYWYDLEKEEQTNLLLHPFCFMEANSFYEQKQTVEETEREILHYCEQVKKVNGTLITIWHNNFLGSYEQFKGWRELYEGFVKKINS